MLGTDNADTFFLTGVTSVSAAPIEGALPIPIFGEFLTPGMPSTYDLPLNGQGWFLYHSEVYFYKAEKSLSVDRVRTSVLRVEFLIGPSALRSWLSGRGYISMLL